MGNNNTSKEIIKSNKSNKIDNNNTSSKNGIDIKSSSKPLEEQTKECQKEILSDLENIKQEGDLDNIRLTKKGLDLANIVFEEFV